MQLIIRQPGNERLFKTIQDRERGGGEELMEWANPEARGGMGRVKAEQYRLLRYPGVNCGANQSEERKSQDRLEFGPVPASSFITNLAALDPKGPTACHEPPEECDYRRKVISKRIARGKYTEPDLPGILPSRH